MITCRNITLNKGGKTILNKVNFTAQPGEITVLMGKNGSGKTSLLRCISGAYPKFDGEVLFNKQNFSCLSALQKSQIIGIMPQTLPQPAVTVEQLVSFGRRPYTGYSGRLSSLDKEKIQYAMEKTGILQHQQDLVCHLSGGERQIAFFAMLLAQETPVVLLDEPTANLDAPYRQRVFAFLQDLQKAGKTVITTLHSIEDAVQIGSRIWVMDNGKMIFQGTAEEFITGGQPEKTFGLRPVRVFTEEEGSFTVFRPL